MSLLQALLLGAVEGLTEFLPISSTFHLIWASQLLGVSQTDFSKLFDVFIQAGAILAVIFLYFQELIANKSLVRKILVSFLPTAMVGFILYKIIKLIFFETAWLMLFVFITIGLIFILYEWYLSKSRKPSGKDLSSFSYSEAVIVGLIQSIAVIPGVSRAGVVIIIMMILGYRRSEAAKFSFLLAVPTIFAAAFYDLYKSKAGLVAHFNNLWLLIVGFVIAFFFAYLSVKWLINYLQKNNLIAFGWYRIILGVLLLFQLFK